MLCQTFSLWHCLELLEKQIAIGACTHAVDSTTVIVVSVCQTDAHAAAACVTSTAHSKHSTLLRHIWLVLQSAFEKAHQASLAVYDDPPSCVTYPYADT